LIHFFFSDTTLHISLRRLDTLSTPLIREQVPDSPTERDREEAEFPLACLPLDEYQHLLRLGAG
jgi:hypothetical protein